LKYPIFLFCLLIVFSCRKEPIGPPAEKETMLFVLRDMMLIESYISLLKEEDRDSVKTELSKDLLSNYGWNESQLKDFKMYLSNNPEVSLEMHDEVRTEIKKLEAEL